MNDSSAVEYQDEDPQYRQQYRIVTVREVEFAQCGTYSYMYRTVLLVPVEP